MRMDSHTHLPTPSAPATENHDHTASDGASPADDNSSQDELNQMSSESSAEEDVNGSADEDYEVDALAHSEDDVEQPSRSASEESPRPSKRKASPEDDDYIKNNPELYGLRRSVRCLLLLAACVLTLRQGSSSPVSSCRKNSTVLQHRQFLKHSQVESDSEDSGSDINTRPSSKRRKVHKCKSPARHGSLFFSVYLMLDISLQNC